MPVQIIDLSDLSSDQGFAIIGDAAADATGFSVANIGDVNGDGIDDVAVGVLRGDSGAPDGGDVYVIFGKATGFPATINLANFGAADGFVVGGDETGDFAGFSVAGAGDLNGDGIADLVVGALYGDDGGSNAGEAYVIFGRAGPIRSAIDLGSLAANDGFVIQGDRSGDHAGRSVAVAGDINGDGVDDLIVGAFRGDNRGLDAGEAYVVYGIAGLTRPNLDLSSLSAAQGFAIEGDSPGDLAGFSAAGVGDINGDGIDDIAIGSRDNDEGGPNAGAAYVLFGRAGTARPTVNLAALSPTDGFKITGAAAFDELGTSVSGAGDINGDGIDDLVIGAPGNDATAPDAGAAYVIFGRSGASRETVYLNALGASDGFAIFGEADGDSLGNSVSGAGDVNGDGLQDLLVSALYSDGGGVKAGATYVILGQLGGIRSDLSVANLAGREGLVIQGAAAGDYSGRAVSGAGDVNGDGIDDLLVGATGNDAGGDFAGATYVIFGNHNFGSINGTDGDDILVGTLANNIINGLDGNDTLAGEAGSDILNGGNGSDRLVGGAGADTMNGEAGNDRIVIDNEADMAIGGNGIDTVEFVSAGLTYLLAPDVEIVSNHSGGDLTLTMNALGNTFGGSAGVDLVSLGDGGDSAYGRGGDDQFLGEGGNDYLFGEAGNDRLDGGSSNDFLYGGSDNDTVIGGAGADTIYGQDGDDVITGGSGLDQLFGGAGSDRFVFTLVGDTGSTSVTADRIGDFSIGQGDRIDLSAMDAITGGADDSFSFIGSTAFTGVAGQLRAVVSGSSTIVSGDVNGDGVADFLIRIDGAHSITAGDLVI